MKTYSKAPDADFHIERMRAEYHPDLDNVTIVALFTYDDESGDSVLKHQGYPAQAVVRITPLRDRAQGVADACIVVDRANWTMLSALQRDALIDHELTHLSRVVDEETSNILFDAIGRPKLAMRPHDHQFGWFDEIAQRHGESSPEVRQAKLLMESSGQLYFDFGSAKAARKAKDLHVN